MSIVPFLITEEDMTNKASAFKFNEMFRRILITEDNIASTFSIGGGGAIFVSTETESVTNTTDETTIIPAGWGSLTITNTAVTPKISVGKTYRITAYGDLSTLADTSGTLNVILYYGTTVLCSTSAQYMLDGLSARMWKLTSDITFCTIGATGTAIANGLFQNSQAGLPIGEPWWWEMKTTSAVTVDTTTDVAFNITATFSVASASNIFNTNNFVVEQLN